MLWNNLATKRPRANLKCFPAVDRRAKIFLANLQPGRQHRSILTTSARVCSNPPLPPSLPLRLRHPRQSSR
eukprot:scaffold17647_cov51-Isochrysis_galbana.AAC.1